MEAQIRARQRRIWHCRRYQMRRNENALSAHYESAISDLSAYAVGVPISPHRVAGFGKAAVAADSRHRRTPSLPASLRAGAPITGNVSHN